MVNFFAYRYAGVAFIFLGNKELLVIEGLYIFFYWGSRVIKHSSKRRATAFCDLNRVVFSAIKRVLSLVPEKA